MDRSPQALLASCSGAGLIASSLRGLGVEVVFCYPGGANLAILDALSASGIELLRTEHEQGAVFAAQGYARASGALGVCVATSGPGATNLVTGIADANSDSIPVLALTGNVATPWLGRNAFQEVDIVAVVRPITKLARQVRSPADIAAALEEAARTALDGRPGPVLLDFPKDVQQARVQAPASSATKESRVPRALDARTLAQISALLAQAKRPVIYAGGGVIASGTGPLLLRLAENLDCPVALTLMGLGAMPPGHPLLLGPLGMHGAWCANVAVNEADVVLALGVRFDDRVIGAPAAFARDAAIVHIDIDPNELGKNKPVRVAAQADLRAALAQLVAGVAPIDTASWREYLLRMAAERPLRTVRKGKNLSGSEAIATLAQRLPRDAIVTTGVGQHQMWAMQQLSPAYERSFLSSSGFGTMGFGLPAALGAKRARPRATVVDIDGDGSLAMTVNELAACRRYGLGVKVFVVNNRWLGMVRQWQDLIYEGNRVASAFEGPDFVALATGYGVRAERAALASELPAMISRLLEDPDEPRLLDVMVERECNVFPMIPAGKSYRDVIFDEKEGTVADT